MPCYRMLARGMKLPRIGTIRKGEQIPVLDKETKKPKLNKAGEAIMRPIERPYFVIHTDSADDEGTLEKIYAAYGSREITSLNVYLLYSNARDNWSAWMEAYTASQLVARSDEQIITKLNDPVSGKTLIRDGVVVEPSPPNTPTGKLIAGLKVGDQLPYDENMILALSAGSGEAIRFKAVGRLSVVIKELQRPDRWFNVVTGAYWYDLPFIETAIAKVEDIARYSNRPANTIPLLLKRVPIETSYEDENGKTRRKVMHCIQLEVRDDVIAALMAAYEETPFIFQISSAPVLPALPDGREAAYVEGESFEQPDETEESSDKWNEEVFEQNIAEEAPVSKPVARQPGVPVISPKFLVNEQLAPNEDIAAKLIALLMIDGAEVEQGKARIALYHRWREDYPRNDNDTRKQCAEKAIAGEVPPPF